MPSQGASGHQVERQLVAILAADLAGYSRLMGADEEGTLAQIRACQQELIEPRIVAYHGRVVKTASDGMLVRFISPVEAVRCAVEMQQGMTRRNAHLPDNKRLEFRIGINLGHMTVEDGDIYGDGVNVAARLDALTEPGGICITRAVRDQVRGRVSFAFEDLGQQQVKNIARPLHVYRLRGNAETGRSLQDQAGDARQGTDLDTPAARAASQGGTANGILEFGNPQFHAARGPDVAAGFGASGAGSSDASHRDDVRPPSTSPVPIGRLGRTAVLFFFMTIVFLAGIFIGASLIADLPTRSAPGDIAVSASIPSKKIESPTSDPATTNSQSSVDAATPRPGPAAAIPAEPTAQRSNSVDARSPKPPEPVTPPKDSPPAAAIATTSPAPEPTPQSPITGSLPLPAASAATAVASVAAAPAPGIPAPAAAPIIATPPAAKPPTEPSAATRESPALVARGDELFAVGDVASARLFYEHASDAGNAAAALRLGETYDPVFLARARLNGVLGDLALARRWYRRARDLGASEAEILLKSAVSR
jgi:class 3 adenylate cyclase